MSWSEAYNELRAMKYGPNAASGLLELADRNGTYTDGNVTVSSSMSRIGYRIIGC